MKFGKRILSIFVILFVQSATSIVLKTNARRDTQKPTSRKLPGDDIINFITNGYPYIMGMPEDQSQQTVSVSFNGTLNTQTDSVPKTHKIVYNFMHFPSLANDPFNLYSLSRAWDPYFGLKPPFNLNHPSNFHLGFQPYPNLGSAPAFPNLIQDPFKTGIYGGYGYGMFGMMSPYILNTAFPAPSAKLRLQSLYQQMNEATRKINEIKMQMAVTEQKNLKKGGLEAPAITKDLPNNTANLEVSKLPTSLNTGENYLDEKNSKNVPPLKTDETLESPIQKLRETNSVENAFGSDTRSNLMDAEDNLPDSENSGPNIPDQEGGD